MSESERLNDRAAPCAANPILSIVPARSTATTRHLVPALLGALIGAQVALAPWAASAQNDPPQMFRIAAPSAEGSGFILAGLIASGLSNPPGGRSCEKGGSCGVPGTIAVVQTVSGADQATSMVVRGQIEAALLPADAVARAVAGGQTAPANPAEKPRGGLRTIATLSITPLQIMMRGEAAAFASGNSAPRHAVIATEEGESSEIAARLTGMLLPNAMIDPAPVETPAGVLALTDGKVDWLAMLGVAPTAGFVEPIRSGLIRPLGLDREAIVAQLAARPWTTLVKIPAGVYADMPEIETLGLPTQLVVSAELSADMAMALARALWQPSTIKLLASARDLKIEQATAGLAAPLHPGAARYYRERGVVDERALGE